ncbi:hypothetical protein BMS3Bbin04_00572 [bacterium BMS3Bbin04]|nr:hypothetical protein BMS3Bbin04_00572 [bacterium BMS3Bbin04]
MREIECFEEYLFANFLALTLNHRNRVFGARDQNLQIALFELRDGRVDNKLPVNTPHTNAGYWSFKRNV